jgi:hypothetical protein
MVDQLFCSRRHLQAIGASIEFLCFEYSHLFSKA